MNKVLVVLTSSIIAVLLGAGSAIAIPHDAAPVPEPATMLLVGVGLIGLAGFRRKFKKD